MTEDAQISRPPSRCKVHTTATHATMAYSTFATQFSHTCQIPAPMIALRSATAHSTRHPLYLLIPFDLLFPLTCQSFSMYISPPVSVLGNISSPFVLKSTVCLSACRKPYATVRPPHPNRTRLASSPVDKPAAVHLADTFPLLILPSLSTSSPWVDTSTTHTNPSVHW